MFPSLVVCGAGPALGRALAERYARAGYAVALVARGRAALEQTAAALTDAGATVHAIPADLADLDGIPTLVARIRAAVGDPEVLYYGAAPSPFFPTVDLTPRGAADLMPVGLYALVALVREFLPAMRARGAGAILSAQGASALRGIPHIGGGFAMAAQRNYLQALHAEVAGEGVYVGGLYIGAAIKGSPFHARREADLAAGVDLHPMPTVDPADLAEQLWTMHSTKNPAEAGYPADLLGS